MINFETIKQNFKGLALQGKELVGDLSGRVVRYFSAMACDLQNNKYEVAIFAGTNLTAFLIADLIAKIIDKKFFNFDAKLTRAELITKHTFINLLAGSFILANNYLAAYLLGYSLNLVTCATILVTTSSIRAIFDRLIRKKPVPLRRSVGNINLVRVERPSEESTEATQRKNLNLKTGYHRLIQARNLYQQQRTQQTVSN